MLKKGTFFLLLSLCGCSLLPDPGKEAVSYDLPILESGLESGFELKKSPNSLRIDLPDTSPFYNSQRFVTVSFDQSRNFLAGVQWSAPFAQTLQSSLIKSLQNLQKFKTISKPGEGLNVTAGLKVSVMDFYISLDEKEIPQKAVVKFYLEAISYPQREVINTKLIEQSLAILTPTQEACVSALKNTYKEALKDVIKWLNSAWD